jgi:hypothetical protein
LFGGVLVIVVAVAIVFFNRSGLEYHVALVPDLSATAARAWGPS